MPRARNIKPGFFKNEDLVELPALTRLLYIGLWCLADREGRLEDRPKRIKMEIMPADDCDVDAALAALADSGFVTRYEAGGCKYIQINNFNKHQNPHRDEKKSSIPPPPSCDGTTSIEETPCLHDASTMQAQCEHSANPPRIPVSPYPRNPSPESPRKDAARACEDMPTGDEPAEVVSLDYHRILDAAAKYGFPVDTNRIDKNVEFCQVTYPVDWCMDAIEKTASTVASGEIVGDLWKYALGILRSYKRNGGPDNTNDGKGPPGEADSKDYVMVDMRKGEAREYPLGKADFDEYARRFALYRDLEVDHPAKNKIIVRRKAACGAVPKPRSP